MEKLVNTLLEMGFPKQRIGLAIARTNSKDLQLVMDWMICHKEELDADSAPFAGDAAPSTSSLERPAPTETAAPSKTAETSETTEKSETTARIGALALEESEKEPQESIKITATVTPSVTCDECGNGKVFKTTEEIDFHAEESGHADFTEFIEEKKQLTDEEKKEQLAIMEAKLRQRRLDREAREKDEALEKKPVRIKTDIGILEAKKKYEELEMKKIIQRKKEKDDERSARQKVRVQILADKLARKVKFGDGSARANEPVAVQLEVPDSTTDRNPSQNYSEVKLQIRLSNGKTLVETFGIKEPLAAVRLFVELNHSNGPFKLMNSISKKVFSSEDYEKPLEALGLAPAATLIVIKA